MGQQLVHEENIMLNLSATDKESVLSQMSDVLFQNGFVKQRLKMQLSTEKGICDRITDAFMFGRHTTYRCRTY